MLEFFSTAVDRENRKLLAEMKLEVMNAVAKLSEKRRKEAEKEIKKFVEGGNNKEKVKAVLKEAEYCSYLDDIARYTKSSREDVRKRVEKTAREKGVSPYEVARATLLAFLTCQ